MAGLMAGLMGSSACTFPGDGLGNAALSHPFRAVDILRRS